MQSNRGKWIFYPAIFIVLLMYVHFAVRANFDLSLGRFAIYMDETITFDGVARILHPRDGKDLWYNITDGGDHRYGRSLWNSIALVSYLPEWKYGPQGQIIAARLLQVLLIVLSCVIVTWGFLKNHALRFIFLSLALLLPFSDYYSTMPKPEPLQIFFLTLFFYLFQKNSYRFGYYWIVLGLAFGTKISTLPAILILGLVALLTYLPWSSSKKFAMEFIAGWIGFLAGLILAVPILFLPLSIVCLGLWLTLRVLSLNQRPLVALWFLYAVLLVGAVLAARNNSSGMKPWIEATFKNTSHGADRASINFLSWIDYLFSTWLEMPLGTSIFFVVSLMLLSAMVLRIQLKAMIANRSFSLPIGAIISAVGLATIGAIFLSAKRLWGFYLFPGVFFILAGLLISIEGVWPSLWNRAKYNLSAVITVALSFTVFVCATWYWAPLRKASYSALADRTQSDVFKKQYATYSDTQKYLEITSQRLGRKILVAQDPNFFQLENNRHTVVKLFWGPFVGWTQGFDVLLLGPNHFPSSPLPPHDSPEFVSAILEREGYRKHVVSRNVDCRTNPCFVKVLSLPNGGELLARP